MCGVCVGVYEGFVRTWYEGIKRLSSNVRVLYCKKQTNYTCKGGIALVGERVSDRRGVPTRGEEDELLDPRADEVRRRGL
jgi:hypothetical protein